MTEIDACISFAQNRKISALQRIPLFQRCRQSILHRVAQRLQTQYIAPGEILSRAGEASDRIFLLAFGDLQVWSQGQEVASLSEAGVVGDPRILTQTDLKTQHNAVAKTFCQMNVLTVDSFMDAAGFKRQDGSVMSDILESISCPSWSTAKKNPKKYGRTTSFKKAATKMLRVIQFANMLNKTTGRSHSIPQHPKKDAKEAKEPKIPETQETNPDSPDSRELQEAKESKESKETAEKELPKERLQAKPNSGRFRSSKVKKEVKEEMPKQKSPQEDVEQAEPQKEMLLFNTEAQKQEISMMLQGLEFFSTLDTFSFERLISLFSKKFWRRNEQLLIEGKPAKAMHVVLQGDVNIIIGGKVLNKLGPKSVLGERSVLSSTSGDPAPCGATVTAASPVVMTLSATRIHLQDLFFKDNGLLEHFQSRFDIERVRRGVTSFRNVKLFREADPSFTQALEVAVKERVFHKGDYLLTQGAPCNEAVLLCRGCVNILTDDINVAQFTVSEMEDAMIFGEFTLLGMWPFPKASIVAEDTCLVQVIHADALRHCLDLYPDESFIFRELVEVRLNKIYQQEQLARKTKSKLSLEGQDDTPAAGEAVPPKQRMRTIPRGIREVKQFKILSATCLRELETYVHKRLFLPDQVIVHQGTDLQDVYLLQQGSCEALVFGSSFEAMEGPCVIGGLPSILTKKVFTTVVSTEPCFVVKISQRHCNAVFEKYHEDRKRLFAAANREFSSLCDEFQQSAWIAQAFQEQLGAMPCLAGSSPEFLAALAQALEPRLLLPGQEIRLSGSKDGRADLYFVFEGHFHCLQKGAVMGTISPKMVFGILEVFGISEISADMRIWSDEICKVGMLTQTKLCDLLHEFPEERGKFEKLVHSLMEDSVNQNLIALPFFSGLNNQQILTVCHLLDRRFFLPQVSIVKEGDGGGFMMVVNCGKVEIIYKDTYMGMLLSGKAFGVSQMMGLHTRYHATAKAKSTCHILLIWWHMLSGLIINAADLVWVKAMKQQAQEIYKSEVSTFAQKLQALSSKARSRHLLMDNVEIVSDLWSLRDIFLEWYQVATFSKRSPQKVSTPKARPTSQPAAGAGIAAKELPEVPRVTPRGVVKPVRVRRDMRWVDVHTSGIQKESAHWAMQPGRLDTWKGFTEPSWLQAVRKESAQFAARSAIPSRTGAAIKP